MRKLLLSATALLGFTAGAMAADLPRRAAPPPMFAPVPVFTWTGFYVGANAGWGWNDNGNNNTFGGDQFLVLVPPGPPFAANALVFPGGTPGGFGAFGQKNNDSSFVLGGQVGFNYQFTPGSGFVVGVEADADWIGSNNHNDNNAFFGNLGAGPTGNVFTATPTGFPGGVPLVGLGVAASAPGAVGNVVLFNNAFGGGAGFGNGNGRNTDWFGTVRARVGYAFDRVLVFATGGFAWSGNGNDNNGFGFGGGGNTVPFTTPFFVSQAAAVNAIGIVPTFTGFAGNRNNNDWGWTIGGGIEYAFTNNLTVKLEGLYVNFDNGNNNNGFIAGNQVVGVTNTGAAVTAGQLGLAGNRGNNNNDDFFIVRAGINFKFGS